MTDFEQSDLVHVVNQAAFIENLLNQVIEKYCAPPERRTPFFWDVILDSSVMSVGAKIRVVGAIAEALDLKFKVDVLQDVIKYRNAFAHAATNARPVMRRGKGGMGGASYYQLQLLRSSGKKELIQREAARRKFDNACDEAERALTSMIVHLEQSEPCAP